MPENTPHEPTDPSEQSTPSIGDAIAAAARKSSLGQVAPGEAPTASALLGAMGGIRGLVESILPGLVFLVVYTFTKQLLPSVLAPLAVSVVFIVVRIATRQAFTSAIAGALGIAISAGLALWTGQAKDNFTLGLIINGVLVVVMLVSIAVRRPFIGVLVGLLVSDSKWRSDKAKLRVAYIATVLWALLPALRLAVELPLYLLDATDTLAAAKLIMGVPLYAILLWVTWLLIRSAWSALRGGSDDAARV
jgi:hypothetical protein